MPRLTQKDFAVTRVEPQLPLPGRRNSRQNKMLREEPENVSREDIAKAVTYIEEAAAGSQALTDEIRTLVIGVKALLETGLDRHALALLVTDKCKWTRNGKQISVETVELVLDACSRLHEHLVKE